MNKHRKQVFEFYRWVAWDSFKQVAWSALLIAVFTAIVLLFIYFGA